MALSAAEIARRLRARPEAVRHYRRGYGALFMDNVLQANEGCDFGILRRLPDDDGDDDLPLGLLKGWVLGD